MLRTGGIVVMWVGLAVVMGFIFRRWLQAAGVLYFADVEESASNPIRVRVAQVVGKLLGHAVVRDHHRLDQDLGADSLDAVELVTALEEEFGIIISDAEAFHLTTVGEVMAHVEAKVRAQAPTEPTA